MLAFIQFASADTPVIVSDAKDSDDGLLRVSGALYKDTSEQDPNYDYYAIKGTLQDLMTAGNLEYGPLVAHMRIAVPLVATETPTNHMPQAGTTYEQLPITFTYSYISFGAQLPTQTITFASSSDATFRYFDWHVDGWSGWHAWVFEDWCDFNIGIRVPQGYLPTAFIQGLGDWYQRTSYGDFKIASEDVYWVTLPAPSGLMQNAPTDLSQQLPTPFGALQSPDFIPAPQNS